MDNWVKDILSPDSKTIEQKVNDLEHKINLIIEDLQTLNRFLKREVGSPGKPKSWEE